VTHVDPGDIPNLTALADTFTVSDATFAAGHSASFGAHVTLAAGTFDGFAGFNPVRSKEGVKPGPGWGCPSRLDALWGPKNDLTYQPSCIPDINGNGPYRTSLVPYVPTVWERLEAVGLTWHIYEGTSETDPSTAPLSVCTYFEWCYGNRFDIEHNSSRGDFVTAAAGGALPSLSFLIPIGDVSQHNGLSLALGDNYIGKMVSAVENGPDWDSTAIFITYDDCGCFYDHVTPPSPAYGLRNPMVIVSPYAKPQGTDSTIAIQPYSMLNFVEQNFGLSPLNAGVEQAYDYANAFDFGQKPLKGPTMTTQTISAGERRRLAKIRPEIEDDPT
jgi:phospholipase C